MNKIEKINIIDLFFNEDMSPNTGVRDYKYKVVSPSKKFTAEIKWSKKDKGFYTVDGPIKGKKDKDIFNHFVRAMLEDYEVFALKGGKELQVVPEP
mgnify:CR=1